MNSGRFGPGQLRQVVNGVELLDVPHLDEARRNERAMRAVRVIHEKIEVAIRPQRRIRIASGDLGTLQQDERPVVRIPDPVQEHRNRERLDRRAAFVVAQLLRHGSALASPYARGDELDTVVPHGVDIVGLAHDRLDARPHSVRAAHLSGAHDSHPHPISPVPSISGGRLREAHQAVDVSVPAGLGAVADLELAVHVREVELDGLLGHPELLGDLPIRRARSH